MTLNNIPIRGVLAAVPTPLSADSSSVDTKAIQAFAQHLIQAGIHGIVTTGTTGELPALSFDEFKQVVDGYIQAVKGQVPVVVGVGANSTTRAVEMCQYAQHAGAASVMVVPPFYDPLSFEALKQFYESVCKSIRIPVMYYNLPGATGIHLSAAQLRLLGTIPGLDFMKDTSGNAKEHVDLLTNPNKDIIAFNGWDTLTFSALAHGATAAVWGAASVVPHECVEFFNTLAVKGDLTKAREQWKFLWAVSDFLESVNYPAGIKAGCAILGHDLGPTRAPVLPLPDSDRIKFEEILGRKRS